VAQSICEDEACSHEN